MKIHWLGTAASEGWPAMFCQCEACREAEKRGGRNIRTRSGALIDNTLLIDLNPDLYYQKLRDHLDLGRVEDILITHRHADHLTTVFAEWSAPPMAWRPEGRQFRIHASKYVLSMLEQYSDKVQLFETRVGEKFTAAGCTVTPLPALHDSQEYMPRFYLLEKGKSSILYAHDTDYFLDEAWEILKKNVKKPLSLVSLDCTNGPLPHNYIGHMGFAENIRVREELLRLGLADDKTIFVCNHFSHNGHVLYEEAQELMGPKGFIISYDGMTIEV